jgi:hypothetical protein
MHTFCSLTLPCPSSLYWWSHWLWDLCAWEILEWARRSHRCVDMGSRFLFLSGIYKFEEICIRIDLLRLTYEVHNFWELVRAAVTSRYLILCSLRKGKITCVIILWNHIGGLAQRIVINCIPLHLSWARWMPCGKGTTTEWPTGFGSGRFWLSSTLESAKTRCSSATTDWRSNRLT